MGISFNLYNVKSGKIFEFGNVERNKQRKIKKNWRNKWEIELKDILKVGCFKGHEKRYF